MKTLILYGDKRDKEIKNTLLSLLSQRFSVNLISDGVIKSTKGKYDLNLIETSNAGEIDVENAILILKNNARISQIKSVDKSTKVIVNSSNTKLFLKLARSIKYVYTCGLSGKDFVTFSSRDSEKPMVSLQRELITLSGKICDPLDVTCVLKTKLADYTILSSVLCMLLLDEITEDVTSLVL